MSRIGIKSGWNKLENLWFSSTDSRIYAVLRIGFALVVLANIVDLWPHRAAFFSEDGLISSEASKAHVEGSPYFSVFLLIHSAGAVNGVFAVAAVASVLLGLGVAPRSMVLLIFLWHLSYTYRAFPVIHGWDIALRITSFILLISPLGKDWTVFQWFRSSERRATIRKVPQYGLVLVQIQLAVIYWQTVWLKLSDAYWRNGEFFSYFMLSLYSRIPAEFWAHQQILSNLLTYGTLMIETAVPLLLWRAGTRKWGFLLGWSLHIGIGLLSDIWLFSVVMMMMYLAFLSGKDLDTVAMRFKRG